MTVNPSKIETWGGKNKTRVRLFKKYDVEKLIHTSPEDFDPMCLTFAGTNALLERLLVNHELVQPKNIITIQTYEQLAQNHHGKEILDLLFATQKKYLRGMKIWPYNFRSFSECYKLDGCTLPSESEEAGWSKTPLIDYMNKIIKAKPEKFDIMDLDMCGIFNENNSESVVNLFRNKVLSDSGVAFITHQKGRDVRGGKLFEVLHGYLKTCPYIVFDSIPHLGEKKWETYIARYIMVPLFYICNAYDQGYTLKLHRLIEYRDKNKGSGLAVNMLQYFFKWFASDTLEESDQFLKFSLSNVLNEEYPYHRWVD